MADVDEFPTDLGDDAGPPRDAMRWTVTVIALSTLGLALLNPGAIDGWIDDLPPGPVTARLADASNAYAEAIDAIRLDAPHARIHAAWKAAERAGWSGRQPIETADVSNPRS